jgi:ribosomal protein S27AE
MTTKTTRDEVLAENEADARATLDNETCPMCGVILRDHYNSRGEWRPCRLTVEQEKRFIELVEDATGFASEAREIEFSRPRAPSPETTPAERELLADVDEYAINPDEVAARDAEGWNNEEEED